MLSVAVDIGGTFTDVVAADWDAGVQYAMKVPTTPGRLVEGIRTATAAVLEKASSQPANVGSFLHGTTIGINAIIQRNGAKVGLLTTEGFEDILEIGRLHRSEISKMYQLVQQPETPAFFLSPRRYRRGIRERIDASGEVIVPFDAAQAESVVRGLLAEGGVEAFSVCFLHSFRNPAHEALMRDVISRVNPDIPVSLSCEVDPTVREYERTVVTSFDAYLRPIIEGYLNELSLQLRQLGVNAPVQIMQSRGGVASATSVARRPISLLLSGPAAGAIGGAFAAMNSGAEDVITIDVGGTSADVSLVEAGRPMVSTEGKVDVYPIRVPMIDITAIGSGGGSIAWVDSAGRAHVGPQSAGADPGPACYGRGGTQPTTTDASVVLGYINPEYFAGGTLALDVDAAFAAVSDFGSRLGLTPVEAASGIHRIINANMADAIRLVSVKRGYDPRRFALVALGGAGALHAGRLAVELGIPKVIVPPLPGVLSALGLLVASVEHDRIETVLVNAETASPGALEETFGSLQAHVERVMTEDERLPTAELITVRSADMRYRGQIHSLEIGLPPKLDDRALKTARRAFDALHLQLYGHSEPEQSVELVNVRVVQIWNPPKRSVLASPPEAEELAALPSRRVYFDEFRDYVETPIIHRSRLSTGEEVVGPAIVEQDDTTLVVYPKHKARSEESGNIIVESPT